MYQKLQILSPVALTRETWKNEKFEGQLSLNKNYLSFEIQKGWDIDTEIYYEISCDTIGWLWTKCRNSSVTEHVRADTVWKKVN